jgi:hypothetical protein
MLFCTQELGTNVPIFYNGTEWLSSTLPVPAKTNVVLAHTAAGNVDVGTHLWRIRWRFTNGASLASDSISHEITVAASTVEFTVLPLSSRSDYVGFSIERTIVGETGLWYAVGDSASKTAVIFTDNTADADLGDLVPAEPGIFGAAPHFDGVIAHQDLLFGWVGSNLYVSDAIGADYGTGVLNFHPYFYQVKADDGDPIKIAVQQLDRLVIVKGSSMHAFTGFDRDSFSCTQIHGEIGTPSTRGAAADGARVFIYGGRSRIFVLEGQAVRGLGNPQITHYLDTIALTGESKVEVVNYRGDKILFGYPARSNGTNDEVLAFSMLGRNWEHYTGIRLSGCLCPKNDTEFGGATMMYGDPRLFDPATIEEGGGGLAPEGTVRPAYLAWLDNRQQEVSGTRQVYAQRMMTDGSPAWVVNGVQISNGTGNYVDHHGICATSPTGMVVMNKDTDSGSRGEIMVRRFNALGGLLWESVASADSTYLLYDFTPLEMGDGSIVTLWYQASGALLYGNKFDSQGNALWGAVGKSLLTTPNIGSVNYEAYRACLDGSGGFWVAFSKNTSPTRCQIARFDSTGTQIGTTYFVNDLGPTSQHIYNMIPDGGGGVWVAWGINAGGDVFCRRFGADGTPAFAVKNLTGGRAMYTQTIQIVSDGLDGVFVAWKNYVNPNYLIVAQHLDPTGTSLFAATPPTLVSGLYPSDGLGQRMIRDSAGGFILGWCSNLDTVRRVCCQRFDADGVPVWASPVVVDETARASDIDQDIEELLPDGLDGCYVSYNNTYASGVRSAKVNRISSDGTPWAAEGVHLSTEFLGTRSQYTPKMAVEGAGYGDLPAPIAPGYRVWSLFDGETDEAAFDGSSGIPIPIMFETPEYDGGEPDTLKSFDRLQVYTKQGVAEFSARLTTENGSANVTFSVDQVNTTWVSGSTSPAVSPVLTADSLIWNETSWAGSKPGEATTGIPSGTLGKRCKLRLAAKVSEKVILLGHALDFQLLPERPYV